MKNTLDVEKTWVVSPDVEAEGLELVKGNVGLSQAEPQKRGISRILNGLPALPRFEDKAQKRAGGNIVKFLAILLALTLIARGTSGATLAKVETASLSRSEIVEAVTGSATVSVRDSLDISAPEGLTILEMLVGTGQTVENGDALALFDMSEVLEKLARESAALEKLLLDKEKLDRADATDSTSLENAMRSLRRAQDDYNAVKTQGETDISTANETLEEVLGELLEDPDGAALENALRSLSRTKEDYNTVMAQGISDVATAQTALKDALDSDEDFVDSTSLDNARRNRNREQEDFAAVEAKVKAAIIAEQEALDEAKKREKELKEAWEADKTNTEAEQAYIEALAETKAAQEVLSEAKKSAETVANYVSAKRRMEDAETSYNQALNNYNNNTEKAVNTRDTAIEKARDAVASAEKKAAENLLSAARRVEDAEVSYNTAMQNYNKSAAQASDAKQKEIENAQKALESAKKKAEENLLSATRRVEDAETSVAASERDYKKNRQSSSDTATQNSVSAITLQLDIEDKKAVVDALKMLVANDGVIYTDISGVVLTTRSAGNITNQDALVAFMDGAKGFEASLQLDKAQADKLSIGDECQVTTGAGSMYFTPRVTGTVSSISAPDEQDRVKVAISLPEADWSESQRVDIQAVQNRSTYDSCVPLSAVRSDNIGYYVLTVEQESTVLGVANTVIRVPVTINASDDDNAAIQGSVGRNSKIITGSNKSVEAGDRVRVSS